MNASSRNTSILAVEAKGILAAEAKGAARRIRSKRTDRAILRSVLSFLLVMLGALAASPAVSFAQEASASKSFVDDFNNLSGKRWYVSDGWSNGNHQNCTWSKNQLKLADGVLTLGFEKRKFKERDYSCAEIRTKQSFGYGVYEARLKADAGPGVNAAFFTYIGPLDKQPHDEIDFEILLKDPSRVQLNTYVSGKGGNEKLVSVEGGADKAFNDYAFVWEPDRLRWFVNGKLLHTVTDPLKLPSHPQKIFFSLWGSDTFTEWLGKFADPGRRLTMELDRVAFTAPGEPCQFPESVACGLQ